MIIQKFKTLSLAIIVLLLVPVAASAHSMMQSSSPSDGEVVSEAPETIGMVFHHAVRLTSLELTTSGGEEISIEIDREAELSNIVAAPLPALAPDQYRVDWRAMAPDGHVMSGSFSFTIEAS